MEWTDISITVAKRDADTAEAIATMVANAASILKITATWNSSPGRLPMWT